MSDTDLELLARYTRHHAEDAFAEIVRRHLDLVFSAALRQVRSPQLAEEVAQSTFVSLARDANRLAPDTILAAWLYQVAHHTAANVVRRETRRQLREQIATEMNAMNATAADWTRIEPLLDAAMHALDDTDRAAVLLRYFENKSLREVGAALGTSDDAAQKRVSRAVERLREFFAKRGVTVGAGGLAVVISANAVQAAPIGLSAAISAAGSLTGATAATLNWLNAKAVVAMVGGAIVAGLGVYLVLQKNLARADAGLRDSMARQEQLTAARDEALATMQAGEQELDRLRNNVAELSRLRGEVMRLRSDALALARSKAGGGQPAAKPPIVAGLSITHVGPAVVGPAPPRLTTDEQIRTNIHVKVGDTYSRVAIDQDVRSLFGTGLFSTVRVSEEWTNEDVLLTYQLQDRPLPAYKVGDSWKLGGSTRGHQETWEKDGPIQTFAP